MKKFTSRKFLLTLVGNIMGIVTLLVGQTTVTTVVGAMAVILANVVYCVVEGTIDAKSVGQIADAVEDIADELGADEQVVVAIDKIGDIAEGLAKDGGAVPHADSE